MSTNRKIYFTAGPAMLPAEVRQQMRNELLNYNGMDIGVMEMSHRSKEFAKINSDTEQELRKCMNIPDDYAVLFMHGGAKSQFDSVVMNLCPQLGESRLDYLVNGTWSKLAASEAEKYAKVDVQHLKSAKFDRTASKEELVDHSDATFRFYCDNETIQGLEFNYIPESGNVPLVTDMTSNFLSRPVDVSKFGVIFAGAQKNCGIAGLCIVIVRKALLGRHMSITPTIQNYKVMADHKSLFNTPLTFNIYVAGLCIRWVMARGGLEGMDKLCRQKSKILYDLIENSGGFYTCPVHKDSRSRMNVVFLLKDRDLDAKFLEESEAAGLYDLKGHRSVGGFRASLYHGISVEDTKRLAKFMTDFQERNSH